MASNDGLIKLIEELINDISGMKGDHKKILSVVEVLKKCYEEDPVVNDLVGWLEHIIAKDSILFGDMETMLKNLNEVLTSHENTLKKLEER